MRPESAGHRRAPLIEPRSSRLPALRRPSGPAALPRPRSLQLPATSKTPGRESPEMWGRERRGGRGGRGRVEWSRGGGGGRLDGGIPYLLLRGCCSVVRDCLELPPVPGIFKGNTKACDGPDLLELPFFYVSLHFLLCYTPPLLFLLLFSSLSGLPHSSLLSFPSSLLSISHFTRPLETF